jgi:hypothetical protein
MVLVVIPFAVEYHPLVMGRPVQSSGGREQTSPLPGEGLGPAGVEPHETAVAVKLGLKDPVIVVDEALETGRVRR